MSDIFHIGSPPIAVHLQRSARARRFSLRVSNTDGRVSLTLPRACREKEAMAFAMRQEGWLRKTLAKRPTPVMPAFGDIFPIEGTDYRLAPTSGRKVLCRGDTVYLPGRDSDVAARLKGFLRVRARDRISGAAHPFAAELGKSVMRITLRDTRSRWGSCSSEGNLMFSWRLIMAPPPVLDYVVAHEIAHLVEMNHSSAFWRIVAGLMPDYEAHRTWLRHHGQDLHKYDF